MTIAAQQRHMGHLQQVQRQPPGAPAEQTPRIDLQPDGQLCQLLQFVDEDLYKATIEDPISYVFL